MAFSENFWPFCGMHVQFTRMLSQYYNVGVLDSRLLIYYLPALSLTYTHASPFIISRFPVLKNVYLCCNLLCFHEIFMKYSYNQNIYLNKTMSLYVLLPCSIYFKENTHTVAFDFENFHPSPHCVLNWGITRTFPGNQDATLK